MLFWVGNAGERVLAYFLLLTSYPSMFVCVFVSVI